MAAHLGPTWRRIVADFSSGRMWEWRGWGRRPHHAVQPRNTRRNLYPDGKGHRRVRVLCFEPHCGAHVDCELMGRDIRLTMVMGKRRSGPPTLVNALLKDAPLRKSQNQEQGPAPACAQSHGQFGHAGRKRGRLARWGRGVPPVSIHAHATESVMGILPVKMIMPRMAIPQCPGRPLTIFSAWSVSRNNLHCALSQLLKS